VGVRLRTRSLVVGACAALLGPLFLAAGPVQAAPATATPAAASTYTPLTPVRVLDTRTGTGAPAAPVAGGSAITLDLAGRVPTGATAVVLNVTGTEPTAPTFVTAYPHGTDRPLASNLNLVPGETRPNLVTVMVGQDRVVDLYNNAGNTHLVADLSGYYSTGAGARFTPRRPERVFDTRWHNPPTRVGQTETVSVDLSRYVPESATAVTVNLTATEVTDATFVTAWPHGRTRPLASNLNPVAGDTVANLVTVPLGTGRTIDLYNNWGQAHLIADLAGFYTADYGAMFVPQAPSRVLDTRDGTGTFDGRRGPVDQDTNIAVLPGAIVPDEAIAAVVNFTGTNPTAATYVTAWQLDSSYPPQVSTLNLRPDQTVPNLAVVALRYQNPYSRFYLYNHSGQVDMIGDLAGYFVVAPTPCTTGCVYGWGDNFGSLGIGTTTAYTKLRTQLPGLTGVTKVSGRYALRADGTVWAWAWNYDGSLGNGWYDGEVPFPVPVLDLTGVIGIADGGSTGFALRADGTVWAWGANLHGQLGNRGSSSTRPVRVPGLDGIRSIETAGGAAYALRADGTVLAWGPNESGQLGNGSTVEDSAVPVQVSGLTGVRTLAGGSAAYAVRDDGTVWAWGRNDYGQLGNGSTVALSRIPVQVSGLSNVIAAGGDYSHGFAVRGDGTAWGWGDNNTGGLGNGVDCSSQGTTRCVSYTPVQVRDLTGVRAIDGFGNGGYALRDDGTVWAWGYDQDGNLGDPGAPYLTTVPLRVAALSGVTAIEGGYGGHAIVANP
jgi:alpha-tubulin suppressor-like RCC1 family protein